MPLYDCKHGEETTRFKSAEENFVTVVSVQDENLNGSKNEFYKESPMNSMDGFGRPQPAPRHFVTVVSVESSTNFKCSDEEGAVINSSTKVRLDVPGNVEETLPKNQPKSRSNKILPLEAVVYRLPGERLGFGLKFDGGTGSTEKIRRLFIQSIAPDSPAARATVPWGKFEPGDEILHIEGAPVSSMTRVECVSLLKEASVKLILGVSQGEGFVPSVDESSYTRKDINKRPPPPPLPLRSHAHRTPARPPKDGIPPPEGFEDSEYMREADDKIFRDSLENSAMPPTPAFYLDLLSEEDRGSRTRYESESDETNSSASTIVDKLSLSSSRTVSRNSSFNATMDYGQFDLARAVSPFEHLENEINKAEHRKSSQQFSNEESSTEFPEIDDSEMDSQSGFGEEFNSLIMVEDKSDPCISISESSEQVHHTISGNKKQENIQGSSGNIDSVSLKKTPKRIAPLPPVNEIRNDNKNESNSNYEKSENPRKDNLILSSPSCQENLSDKKKSNEKQPLDDATFDESSNNPIEGSEYLQGSEEFHDDEDEISDSRPITSPRLTFINKTYDSYGIDVCAVGQSKTAKIDDSFNDDTGDNEGYYADDSVIDDEDDYPFYEKPLEANQSPIADEEPDSSIEPIDINTYEDSSYFVDRVSNPSYGLPFSNMSAQTILEDYPDKLEDIYEEIETSSLESLKNESAEQKIVIANDSHTKVYKPKALSSIESSSGQSLSSLESKCEEHISDFPLDTEDSSQIEPHMITAVSNPIYENQETGEQMNSTSSPSTYPRSFSVNLKKSSQVRKDLSDLLKEEMNLEGQAEIIIEEEEEIESKIECETEDEVLLVLRALRRDNSLYLDEEGNDSTVANETTNSHTSLQAPVKSPLKRKHHSLEAILEKGVAFSDVIPRKSRNKKFIPDSIPESNESDPMENESESIVNQKSGDISQAKIMQPNDMEFTDTSLQIRRSNDLNVSKHLQKVPTISILSESSKSSESSKDLPKQKEGPDPTTVDDAKINISTNQNDEDSSSQSNYDNNKEYFGQVDFSTVTVQIAPTSSSAIKPTLMSTKTVPNEPKECHNQEPEALKTSLDQNIEQNSISSSNDRPLEENVVHIAERISHGEQADSSLTLYEQRCSSLSSQDSPSPPSYSRLPPDGHEFPSNYSEGLQPDKINHLNKYSSCLQDIEIDASNVSFGPQSGNCSPSTLPRGTSKSPVAPASETRSLSRWRRQDEKSERSVKDKIAMFSSEKDSSKDSSSPHKSKRLNRSESISSVSSDMSSNRLSSLIEDSPQDRSKKENSPDKIGNLVNPSFRSMLNVNSTDFELKENVKPSLQSKTKDTTGSVSSSAKQVRSEQKKIESPSIGLNTRSQSLLDIDKNSTSRMKRHSVGAYDRPFAYKYGVEKPEDRERRTSLNNLIEQRRKSISKLRGLVIPETKSGDESDSRVPLNLPKISSATQNIKSLSLHKESANKVTTLDRDFPLDVDIINNKFNSGTNSIKSRYTKSSPHELRRNSIPSTLPPSRPRSTPSPSPNEFSGTSTPRKKSPQRNQDSYGEKRNSADLIDNEDKTPSIFGKIPSPKTFVRKPGCEGRYNRASEDSDNDSAVSSTQSSFSQGLSPRDSPMPDISDQEDNPYSYPSVRPRHSSQSSFDEIDSKRVLKSGSIEAKNRRNILKSAKCSSGRSSDEQSTPELGRKHLDYSGEVHHGPLRKRNVQREASYDSTSSASSRTSSMDSSSRRNSKESVVQLNKKHFENPEVSAQQIYLDKNGDMYKESQIKIAYLNEITDNFEELNETKEVIAEVRIPSKLNVESKCESSKWSTLEQKYSHDSRHKFTKLDSLGKDRSGVNSKKTNFEAVASKWKQRAEEDPSPRHPQSRQPRKETSTKLEKFKQELSKESSKSASSNSPDSQSLKNTSGDRPTSLDIPRADIDRKYSVPEYGNSVKYRSKKEGNGGEISSRPTSLIEGSVGLGSLQNDQYIVSLSSSLSTDSHDDMLDSSESSLSRAGSKEVLNAFMKPQINSVIPKMSEIMKAFERHDLGRKEPLLSASHPRMSSLDSTASDDGPQGAALYGSVSSLASGQRDQYGSITSLSSSTSIISPQELAQLIEEANHSLEESGTPSHEILVVVLHREVVGYGSIGITLAGGADYETKEITVHKVIPGSLADRDGRIQKGDRVISINGKTLRGVTHREALSILKSPRPEVVLVLSRSRSVTPQESTFTHSNGADAETGFSHRPVFINHVPPPRPPKILESPMDSKSLVSDLPCETVPRGPPMTVNLMKEGAGLGFSLEGGKDSPLGDRPLTIKKIFSGGAADKGGILKVGDELLSVNSVDLTNMARIEAWNFLKKLPDGTVSLVIRQKLKESESNEL